MNTLEFLNHFIDKKGLKVERYTTFQPPSLYWTHSSDSVNLSQLISCFFNSSFHGNLMVPPMPTPGKKALLRE